MLQSTQWSFLLTELGPFPPCRQESTSQASTSSCPRSTSDGEAAGAFGAAERVRQLTAESVAKRTAAMFPAGACVPAVKPRQPAAVETITSEICGFIFDAARGAYGCAKLTALPLPSNHPSHPPKRTPSPPSA